MQELDDLIMAPGDIDAARHEEIAQRMDLTSAADYWLLQDISFNTDAFATTSTYLYKERDGKLYWGPLWDFDYAWNNNGLWNDNNRTFNNTTMLWIDALRDKDPLFVSLLQERWTILNGLLEELTEADGIIDQYAAEASASQRADYEIWKDTTGDYQGTSESDYNAAIEALRSWIIDRRSWAEENKEDIGTVFFTVSYEADGQVVATERVRYGNKAVMDPDAPAPEGKVFSCWKKGYRTADKVEIKEDTVFIAEYVDEGEAVAPESLTIVTPEETVELSRGFFPTSDMPETTLNELAYVEPYNTTNPRIRWTSSDEAVAAIDEVNHRVILNGGGDATITGTLYNGVTASFVLHVQGKPAKYTVRFLNDDGTELQSSMVPRGETPAYTGATSTKDETAQYTYEFVGWTPEVVPVTGNAEYRATYAEKAKPGVYEVTSGANGAWTEGSTNPLVFVFERTVDDETTMGHFVGIEVDGKAVAVKDSSGSANFTVESGSAIVSLQPSFLGTLEYGDHTLKASFDDGNDVEVPFRTVAKENPSPDSKDEGKKDDKDSGSNKDSGTSTSTSGTSRKATLPKTGDTPSGAVVRLVIAAACVLLLALLLRGKRNHHA